MYISKPFHKFALLLKLCYNGNDKPTSLHIILWRLDLEMKNLDEVYDIYQDFMDSVDWRMRKTNMLTTLDDGKERGILEFSNGFTVELLNDPKLEEGALKMIK